MSHKTLAEAAAEVLNKSRATAPSEPMHHEPSQPASDGAVNLGGVTYDNPQATPVGKITAANRKQAEKPGAKPDNDEAPMEKLPEQPGSEGSSLGSAKVSPDDLNGTQAGSYAKPTNGALARPNQDDNGASKDPHIHQEETEIELTPEEIQEAKNAKVMKMKEKMKAKSCKEDIDAILAGQTFSDEFRTKLTTIFETAVIARAVMVVEEMEQDILEAAEESVADIEAELEAQVDDYLTSMVAEWKEENKLAIETGLKAELVEDFLGGLKALFEQHYIDLPEEQVNVVESLSAEIAELTEKLNTAMNGNVELQKKINEAKKTEIVAKVCEGLTATQASKVKALAEGVEFTTDGEYTKKLQIIREGYSGTKVKQDSNNAQVALVESEVPAQDEEVSSTMAQYVAAISRSV
jgi:hypothetical protein